MVSATDNTELIMDTPFIRIYKDGHVDRLDGEDIVTPPTDQQNGSVAFKDITFNSITTSLSVSARLFIPTTHLDSAKKLPVLIYFHGSAFMVGSPFCSMYHNHVSTLVEKSNVIAVSVRYRRAPENPIPAAYEDSWAAIKWVVSHKDGSGPDPWLNSYADFNRLFLAGDSAGGNIAHNMTITAESSNDLGVEILGMALIHPYFWGATPVGSEADHADKAFVEKIWPIVCPDGSGNDDPRLNPLAPEAPGLEKLGCRRVLVCVGEKDVLKDRGHLYYEALRKSDWKGVVEFYQQDVPHCIHLVNPETENANKLVEVMAEFFNKGLPH